MPGPLCVPGVRERGGCREGKVTRRGLGTEGRTMWWREEEERGKERKKPRKICWREREKSRGAAKKLAARRDAVGEGCSDGADLRSTSSFLCPVTLILGREDVARAPAPVCQSVVAVYARPAPWASGLCASLSLNTGGKISLVSDKAEKRCCICRGEELKDTRKPELLGCPVPS